MRNARYFASYAYGQEFRRLIKSDVLFPSRAFRTKIITIIMITIIIIIILLPITIKSRPSPDDGQTLRLVVESVRASVPNRPYKCTTV